MPITFDRDDAKRRVVLVAQGAVTAADLIDVINRQAAERVWDYSVMYDSSQITDPPSAADLRRVASHATLVANKIGKRGPVAMFAPQDVVYGTARMYESVADDRVVWRVFRTRGEAEAWLDSISASGPQ